MANIIEMPKLSDTMTVGTLVKWLKKEGDVVKSGTTLAEVETDKATMELECFFDGTILKIFAEAGSQVALGAPLCAVGKPGEVVEAPAGKPAAPAPAKEETQAAAPAPVATSTSESKPATPAHAPAAPARADGERVKISPLAKKLAAEKGVDASSVTGSGPGGRIVRADIEAAAKAPKSSAAPSSKSSGPSASFAGGTVGAKGPVQQERAVPVSTMRGVIAKRLLESKTTIPHFYLEIEIDAEPLLALREQLNKGLEAAGVKLSVNDFILKASAEALRRVPDVNTS
jgi:pyruvate dehydrogenase E2 component (dihydrolipoamide acetyltransferase)